MNYFQAEKRIRTIITCCRGFVKQGNDCISKNIATPRKSMTNEISIISYTPAKPTFNMDITTLIPSQPVSSTIFLSNLPSSTDSLIQVFTTSPPISRLEVSNTDEKFIINSASTITNTEQESISLTTAQNNLNDSILNVSEQSILPFVTNTLLESITYAVSKSISSGNEIVNSVVSETETTKTVTQSTVVNVEEINSTSGTEYNENNITPINSLTTNKTISEVEKPSSITQNTVNAISSIIIQNMINDVSLSSTTTITFVTEINVNENVDEKESVDETKIINENSENSITVSSQLNNTMSLIRPILRSPDYVIETVETIEETTDKKFENLPNLITTSNINQFSNEKEIETKREILSTVEDVNNDIELITTTIKTSINTRKKPFWQISFQRFIRTFLEYFNKFQSI